MAVDITSGLIGGAGGILIAGGIAYCLRGAFSQASREATEPQIKLAIENEFDKFTSALQLFKAGLDTELAKFKSTLVTELMGQVESKYVMSAGAQISGREIVKDLSDIRRAHDELSDYTHKSSHDTNGAIHKMYSELEREVHDLTRRVDTIDRQQK